MLEKKQEEYSDYLFKIKTLHKRLLSGDDIDVIIFFLFDSLKCLQDELKSKNALDEEEISLLETFKDKAENVSAQVKQMKQGVDELYQSQNYLDLYLNKHIFHRNLKTLNESKQEIKQYINLVEHEHEEMMNGVELLQGEIENMVWHYFNAWKKQA